MTVVSLGNLKRRKNMPAKDRNIRASIQIAYKKNA